VRRILSSCLALIAALCLAPATGRGQPTPLRSVDWFVAIAQDPHITVDPSVPALDAPAVGRYITADVGDHQVEGYPVSGDPRFGDLDGDGAEEAVINVVSGGTAGQTGLLVFHQSANGPLLVAALDGYKMYARIVNDQLVVGIASYAGFEPNCCPSAVLTTTYLLGGDGLVAVSVSEERQPVQALTVEGYYQALDGKDFANAYAFLSPAYQAAHPYDSYIAGYATTISIRARASDTDTPNVVRVELTATDSAPSGSRVTRRFIGAWTLIWGADAHRWLLDRAAIAAVD